MHQTKQIHPMLNSDDLEMVINGLTLLESLVEDEDTLYEYIPCKDCSSFDDVKELFKGEHCRYLALWTLGMLASFEVQWTLDITELDLEGNELTELPETIGNLTQLKSLNLQDNNFSDSEKENIRKMMSHVKDLSL